ncbi:MAG: hypothetical protein E7382_00630 [Clostridiales bacterium]|nr:hypothetical protein [Clostridiales bacterium]
MKISSNLITAVLTIVLGALLIIFKGFILNIAMTIVGVGLIVWAVIDALDKKWTPAIIKGVAGVLLIVLGWLITGIILYVLAGLLLVYAVYQIYLLVTAKKKKWELFVQPVLFALIAILFFLQGFGWAFVVAGIILVIQGILALIACFK